MLIIECKKATIFSCLSFIRFVQLLHQTQVAVVLKRGCLGPQRQGTKQVSICLKVTKPFQQFGMKF